MKKEKREKKEEEKNKRKTPQKCKRPIEAEAYSRNKKCDSRKQFSNA